MENGHLTTTLLRGSCADKVVPTVRVKNLAGHSVRSHSLNGGALLVYIASIVAQISASNPDFHRIVVAEINSRVPGAADTTAALAFQSAFTCLRLQVVASFVDVYVITRSVAASDSALGSALHWLCYHVCQAQKWSRMVTYNVLDHASVAISHIEVLLMPCAFPGETSHIHGDLCLDLLEGIAGVFDDGASCGDITAPGEVGERVHLIVADCNRSTSGQSLTKVRKSTRANSKTTYQGKEEKDEGKHDSGHCFIYGKIELLGELTMCKEDFVRDKVDEWQESWFMG